MAIEAKWQKSDDGAQCNCLERSNSYNNPQPVIQLLAWIQKHLSFAPGSIGIFFLPHIPLSPSSASQTPFLRKASTANREV